MTPRPNSALALARNEATEVVGALAIAIGKLITAEVWDPPVRTVSEIQRVSGLSHRAAWQLHRVGFAEEPMAEARHMPKRPAFSRFCAAAKRAGAKPDLLEEGERAFEAFEAAVRAIAGDREAFAGMADAWCGKESSESSIPYLRQAFRANRHIWGISAKASFMTWIALPPPDHWILLRGLCSLRSYRSRAWDVCTSRSSGLDHCQPLEFALADGTNLIPKYCRGPIPKLDHRIEGDLRFVRAWFDVSGAVTPHTLVFGERESVVTDRDGMNARLFSAFPTERMRIDLLAHRSFRPTLAGHDFYSGFTSGSRQLESVPIEVQQRESATRSASLRELSSYGALLEEALGLRSYSLDEFMLFRATCEYPPTGGILEVNLEFDCPEGSP